MGSVAARLADFSIITNDNPRSEDPMQIIEQIKEGFVKENKNNFMVEPKRKKGIELSLNMAKSKDTVLIAGKGHEDYQIIGKDTFTFDDRKVVMGILKGKQ